MDFKQYAFLAVGNSRVRGTWIREPGISIYVRKSVPGRETDFDLASMEADEQGGGALTQFLDKYEPHCRFYVENVLTKRLVEYFKRRGYTIDDRAGQDTEVAPSLRGPRSPKDL